MLHLPTAKITNTAFGVKSENNESAASRWLRKLAEAGGSRRKQYFANSALVSGIYGEFPLFLLDIFHPPSSVQKITNAACWKN